MSSPVDGMPEVVAPAVTVLKFLAEKRCKVCKTHGRREIAGDSVTCNSQRAASGRNERNKGHLGSNILDVGSGKGICPSI